MLSEDTAAKKGFSLGFLFRTEDWWTVWLGTLLLVLSSTGVIKTVPRLKGWTDNIASALPADLIPGLLALGAFLAVICGIAYGVVKRSSTETGRFLLGYPVVFLLAVLAYAIGNQETLKQYGFNDVIWALALGLVISNVFGKPKWLVPALQTELFIKTGLVVMGAELLFNRILVLGGYGLGVAWLGCPLVLFLMYQYGIRILKMKDKSLVATIAACTSVCGVSAAVATGAATKAKKEEISMAISISLIFTVVMMILEPLFIKWLGLSDVVGGAWIGGTVDSTGAVVVAGSMVSELAMEVAAVIKMLQNLLIGAVAFVFALVFVAQEGAEAGAVRQRPRVSEIWRRMPKFIFGFVLASLVFSFILIPWLGQAKVDGIVSVTKNLKNWLFTLAFVSIGLDSRFSDMAKMYQGGKPVKLYIVGQTLNIIVTLIAALIFFGGYFFPVVA
ncbi:MAG TPA: putative sulfate exporter family transporter [Limnochordia bacterium]|nr:putative sulfate exporter family transporter [Limnochordia bacterium]